MYYTSLNMQSVIFYQYNFAMSDIKHAKNFGVMLQKSKSRRVYNSATDPYIMIRERTSQ